MRWRLIWDWRPTERPLPRRFAYDSGTTSVSANSITPNCNVWVFIWLTLQANLIEGINATARTTGFRATPHHPVRSIVTMYEYKQLPRSAGEGLTKAHARLSWHCF
jgi:hypothetical protein